MSVFIKTHCFEVLESRQAVKEAKTKLLTVSGKTREVLKLELEYNKKVEYATTILTELKTDLFKLKNLLPDVPESIIPGSKFSSFENQEIKKTKKIRNHHEELQTLRKMIEEL